MQKRLNELNKFWTALRKLLKDMATSRGRDFFIGHSSSRNILKPGGPSWYRAHSHEIPSIREFSFRTYIRSPNYTDPEWRKVKITIDKVSWLAELRVGPHNTTYNIQIDMNKPTWTQDALEEVRNILEAENL